MPYSDNNPERRNLTVLSLAIIIYYLADGRFDKSDGVSFPLIKLHFDSPEILVYIVWVALFWFLYRYRVARNLECSLRDISKSPAVKMDYEFVKTAIKNSGDDGIIKLQPPCQIYIETNNKWYFRNKHHNAVLTTGFRSYVVRLVYLLKSALTHKAAADYFTPYILFWAAVGLGIYNNKERILSLF